MAKEIRVEKIVKRFDDTTAIKKLSFLSKSGINLILGPNGAGKSTLLRCISGLYRPDSGRVTVLGSDPYKNAEVRMRMAYLADNYGLYDFLTMKDNLEFFGRFYGMNKEESLARVKGLIKELELGKYLDMKVETLSRGTKQKVAFCRTMLNDAEVLLLDEPTAFLDVRATNSIREHLEEISRGNRTVIFVTQRLDEVTRFNSRILVLRKGEIVTDTNTKGLYDSILKDAHVTIRTAAGIKDRALKSLHNVVATNGAQPTSITIKVKGYKQINEAVSKLMEGGAYVVSIDYIEPAIDELLFGERNAR